MPLYISIRFLTGRAHLHHWHAHHSDGKVDWPPSPWRLLRALVAAAGTGLTSLPEPLDESISDTSDDPLPVSRLADLLAMLATSPKIWLPHTGGGHTRQFLPKKFKSTGSAVFDTFATVSKETPIVFEWAEADAITGHVRLTDLQTLLRRLTYFGRAESWCDATAHTERPPEVKPDVSHWCCMALEPSVKPNGRREHVDYTLERKLTPLVPLNDGLRKQVVEMLSALDFRILESTTAKKTGKASEKWVKATPAQLAIFKQVLAREPEGWSLLRCLLRSSGEDINDGLERPIGSRWVHYSVPRRIYQVPTGVSRPSAQNGVNSSTITLVRFALNTATVNRPVLPPLTDTLLVADKFRSAALAWHGHLRSNEHPRNLCGREDDRSRVVGHDHAYFWPMDEDGDGFIDHVSVFCPAGFRASETDALRRLMRIKQRGGRPDLLVTPLFLGQHEHFWPEESRTSTFVSATPYFSPVHVSHGRRSGEARNRGGRSRLGKQVLKSLCQAKLIRDGELASIDQIAIPPIGEISSEFEGLRRLSLPQFPGALCLDAAMPFPLGFNSAIAVENGGRWIRSFAFCRRRRDYEVTANGRMLMIEFAASRPARPFAIGDQAHFGFGLFQPIRSPKATKSNEGDSHKSILNQSIS